MKSPGMSIYHGESQPLKSAGGLSPGTAVGFDANGQVAPVLSDSDSSTTNITTCIGVVANTVDPAHNAGDMISVQTAGTIVTSVTGGVTPGELGISATQGALKSGGTGAGVAFSDAGGSYRGPLPAGYAAVRFGGVV